MLHSEQAQYHISARKGDIGGYCLLPGDPGRCEKIAAYLEEPYRLCQNREYNIWCGTLVGELVTVCSTGIGGPSTAIAAEELAACGAHTMIRIGTCGGIALPVEAGHLVIASGAVRQDGTSRDYGQHSPARMPTSSDLLAKWEAWKRLGVLASEMEAATLFTVGATLGLRTGAVFSSVWNQERFLAGLDTDAEEMHDTDSAIRCAIGALRILIAKDQKKD